MTVAEAAAELGRRPDEALEIWSGSTLEGPARLQLAGTQPVGPLVFLLPLLRRFRLRQVVDQLCPSPSAISHGQVVEALIANRLTDPEPLYRVVEWARTYDSQHWWGIAPEQLNDDRLAETLDAIAPHIEGLQAKVAAQIVRQCGVSLERIFYDLTSLLFYTQADTPERDQNGQPSLVRLVRGHSHEHRPELRQIVCGVSVTADGLLPLLGESHDGNQAETPTVLPHLKKLQQELMALFGVEKLFVLGDSKLVSVETAQGMKQAGIDFLAPSTRSGHWEKRLRAAVRARRRGQWQPLSYQSVRAQLQAQVKQPRQPHSVTSFEGYESPMVLSNGRETIQLREIFIYDSALAEQQRALRQHHLERVKELIEQLRPRLGKWSYTSRAAIERKIEQLLVRHPSVREFLSIVVRERQGRFELVVRERTGRLREAAEQDGISSLLTAASPERLTLEEALRADREQTCIERRMAEVKGPLRVRPVFVRTPARIVALVGLTMIALLLWATVERQCRRGQEQEQGPTLTPITAKQIWRRFKHLGAQRVRVWRQGEVSRWVALDPLTPAQAEVLRWLGITAAEIRARVQDSS